MILSTSEQRELPAFGQPLLSLLGGQISPLHSGLHCLECIMRFQEQLNTSPSEWEATTQFKNDRWQDQRSTQCSVDHEPELMSGLPTVLSLLSEGW